MSPGPGFLPTGQSLPALVTPKRLQTSTGGRWSETSRACNWSRRMLEPINVRNVAYSLDTNFAFSS